MDFTNGVYSNKLLYLPLKHKISNNLNEDSPSILTGSPLFTRSDSKTVTSTKSTCYTKPLEAIIRPCYEVAAILFSFLSGKESSSSSSQSKYTLFVFSVYLTLNYDGFSFSNPVVIKSDLMKRTKPFGNPASHSN